jgi:hypothetical protein
MLPSKCKPAILKFGTRSPGSDRARRKSQIQETIPAEAQRMAKAGFRELYVHFPYQREIYAHCQNVWADHTGSVFRPFAEDFQAVVRQMRDG